VTIQQPMETTLEASVASTFDVLAWEIELAGARCIFLDALIGELMPTIPLEQRGRLLEGLHAVDLLAQHLTSLSAFARKMSEEAPTGACAPVTRALAEITLGDLADRMFTSFGGEELAREQSDAGDLDLF